MAEKPEPLEGYEEVRRKLRDLGYLDGRIQRFVLRDLAAPGRKLGGLARPALKASAFGGPILGGLLAAIAVAENRPLLRPADGPMLWLYFSALAAAALFALALLAGGIVGALARRRGAKRGDTLRASILVTIPTLGYWTLLWWYRPEGTGFLEDALLLGAAIATTLLVAWLAGLVSLAGIIGRTGQVPDRARRHLAALTGVVVAVVAGVLVTRALVGHGGERGVDPAPFSIRPVEGRLLFVGVDGLDADLIQALEPGGGAESLLEIFREGAVFPLRRPPGREPPEVWTTLVTGLPAAIHGMRSAGAERLPGVATPLQREAGPVPLTAALRFLLPTTTIPASAAVRRAPTLWEIVALREPSAAVGWWASWPATDGGAPLRGYVVSDRVLAKLLAGRADDRDTAPASLFGRLASQFEADRAEIRSEFDRALRGIGDEPARRIAWESFLIDAWHARTARLLLDDPAVRGAFLYLPGLEILRHRLPERGIAVTQQVLEAYVRWLGELVSEATRSWTAGRAVLAGDPGRSADEASEGFVAVLGPSARPGCVGPALSDLDVAPIALDLLGFPASAEMPGRVPDRCLEDSPRRPRIATYGRKATAGAQPSSDYDPEMLERLRSLGYVR